MGTRGEIAPSTIPLCRRTTLWGKRQHSQERTQTIKAIKGQYKYTLMALYKIEHPGNETISVHYAVECRLEVCIYLQDLLFLYRWRSSVQLKNLKWRSITHLYLTSSTASGRWTRSIVSTSCMMSFLHPSMWTLFLETQPHNCCLYLNFRTVRNKITCAVP